MSKKGWIIGGCFAAAGLLLVAILVAAVGYYLYQKSRPGQVEAPTAEESASPDGQSSQSSWDQASPEPATGAEAASASPSSSPIDDIEPDPVHDPSNLDAPLIAGEEPTPALRVSQTPQKLHSVNPVYPEAARQARVRGIVILDATVDEQGRVSEVVVLRSVPALDEAAVDAVKQWRYEPTLIDGRPVSVKFTVTLNFTLS